ITTLTMPATTPTRPWHRIAEVRRQQGISIRSMTRRLGVTTEEVLRQEDPTCNLSLSQLCEWQQVLEVPLDHLLIDLDAPLSVPVLTRARMLRVMKTVQAIRESAKDSSTQRMAMMLVDQLVEVMPELRDVSAWHSVGQRRTQDEVGRVAEQPISDNFAQDSMR
ncbi:MAG: hypothetical protein ACR2NU_00960, partial [Aeoliella sp.]